MKVAIIILAIVLLIAGSFLVYQEFFYFDEVEFEENNEIIEISTGSNAYDISKILKINGRISSQKDFYEMSKEKGYDMKFQAGTYYITDDMSDEQIAIMISEGEIYNKNIVIPEGYEMDEIAEAISKETDFDYDEIIYTMNNENFDYKFLDDIPLGIENRLEGFLYPASYAIKEDTTIKSLVDEMLYAFEYYVADISFYNRIQELNMSVNEVITMASIIEREAVVDEERATIAGVFYNRIEDNINLGSCATVQYILNERKPRLSTKETSIESPYNTYINLGLPPRPIASPGLKSIEAALYPEETEYVYFVAIPDGSGTHDFSITLKEHENKVNKYYE